MKHVSKLLAGVAFAVAVLPNAASAEDKTITAIFCGDKMQPAHAEFIKQWEGKNPGFKVAPEVVGWDQCQDKATTLAAAGTPVGLAYVGSRTLKQFANNELIVPIEFTEEEKKAYYPYIMDTVTTDGRQWGIPVAFSTKALYWNKDLFEKAGLDPRSRRQLLPKKSSSPSRSRKRPASLVSAWSPRRSTTPCISSCTGSIRTMAR